MTGKLYCFGESGNAYKAALTFDLVGIPWEPVFVDFFKGEARSPAFRKINVMGEVPVFVADDGEVMTQSGVMQLWAVEQTGKLGGKTPAEAREVMRWLLWDNHKMSSQIGTLRFVQNFLAPEHRSADVIKWIAGRVRVAYKTLEQHLEGRDWLVGDGPTIADLACSSYLYYPEPFGFDRDEWPAVAHWLDNIAALPGWRHPYDMMQRAFPTAKEE